MGDYTRFKFSAQLKGDTPAEAIEAIRFLLSDEDEVIPSLPAHPFFQDSRSSMVLSGGSAYFDTPELPALEERDGAWHLSCHSSLKNYDRTIEKFCDWVAPYIGEADGTIIGEREFEFDDDPTLLMISGGRIDDVEPRANRTSTY